MVTVLSVILGVMLICGGISCLVLPEITFLTLGYIIGVGMIVDGIGLIIAWFQRDRSRAGSGWLLAGGIISLLLGLVAVCNGFVQLALDNFIIYMAIAWMIVFGIVRIILAFQVRKVFKAAESVDRNTDIGRDWWIGLILGILLLICGIVGIFVPGTVAHTIGILMGISIIIAGVDLIHFGTTDWLDVV